MSNALSPASAEERQLNTRLEEFHVWVHETFEIVNQSPDPEPHYEAIRAALITDLAAAMPSPTYKWPRLRFPDLWKQHARTSAETAEFQKVFADFAAAAGSRDDELVISVLRQSVDLLKKREPRGGTLSDDQVRFLIESGDFTEEEFRETEARVERGELAEEERKTRLEVVTSSLGTAEVAERLGIDTSRVRHRQAKGGLYSFLVGNKRRYPAWQFTGDAKQPLLSGLATLVKGLPEGMHPASVQGFMTTPQESLTINDERVTPAEWLQRGGAPQALVTILDSMMRS
jgi:hypothetical protein